MSKDGYDDDDGDVDVDERNRMKVSKSDEVHEFEVMTSTQPGVMMDEMGQEEVH